MYTLCDIRGLDRAEVFAALFNASGQQGLGVLDTSGRRTILAIDFPEILRETGAGDRWRFDYVRGRVLKIDLSNPDYFDPRLYDRDNGFGAAGRAVAAVRKAQEDRIEAEIKRDRENRQRG